MIIIKIVGMNRKKMQRNKIITLFLINFSEEQFCFIFLENKRNEKE